MSLMDNFTLIPYGYFPLLNCKRTVSKSNLLNQFTVEGNNFFSLTLGKQQPSLQERRQEKSIMRKETTRTDVGQTLKTVAWSLEEFKSTV